MKQLRKCLLLVVLALCTTTEAQSFVNVSGWWQTFKIFWLAQLSSWGFVKKPIIKPEPISATIGDLRYGQAEPRAELSYLIQRDIVAKQALESLLDRSLEGKHVPRIAVLATGGGYRAMLSSIGSLAGAQEIGLLDAITYLSGVSGSCWAFGSWMSSDLSIKEFKDVLIDRVTGNILNVSFAQAQEIGRELLKTARSANRKLTLVDLYGATLGNKLLGPDWRTIYLSDQIKRVSTGERPLPIYTAVVSEKGFPGHWFTFTPYEVGDMTSDWYVPSRWWGSIFKRSVRTKLLHEYPFSYLMGVFGSGFSGSFYHLYQKQLKGSIGSQLLDQLAQKIAHADIGYISLSKSCIPNIGYGIKTYPFSDYQDLHLVDSGLELNLSYPIFGNTNKRNKRTADVWIIFDITSKAHEAFELKNMVAHAQQEGWRLPPIDVEAAKGKPVSIFKDESDHTLPVIIYMPTINSWKKSNAEEGTDLYESYLKQFNAVQCFDCGYAKTMNFTYTHEQAKQLVAMSEYNMIVSKQKIIETLNWVVDNKL